ncbi:uncharacterized protein LOC128998028 isoform X2 [Macrosteles quadrilineatus]|nr:uncharacterized protein LOC128998028 isoform X2 [Macrosteles quadrilineatus]
MSVLLESRSFRPFKSSEEYLYAMKEDIAEWLNGLYPDLYMNVNNFMDRLDTGVALCKHANSVRKYAEEYVTRRQNQGAKYSKSGQTIAASVLNLSSVRSFPGAKAGTFFARDNVSNFISWCRRGLGVFECLLFETDDLIMRKNEKHVILCLLEVARRGAKLGMPAPMLVQLEREIDREIAADKRDLRRGLSQGGPGYEFEDDDDESDMSDAEDHCQYGPTPQIVTNDLKSLDEMVRDLVEKCRCPTQFPMIRVSEGKYRIGDTKVLIFVRVLRSHVMVRVGGGWDTLSHYLDKHDPCRCKTAHRAPVSAKIVGMKTGIPGIDIAGTQVHYERSPPRTRRSSASSVGSNSGAGSIAPPPPAITRNRSRSPNTQRNATLSPGSKDQGRRSRSPTPRRTLTPTPISDRARNRSRSPTPNYRLAPNQRNRSPSPTPRRELAPTVASRNRSRSPTPRKELKQSRPSTPNPRRRSRSTSPKEGANARKVPLENGTHEDLKAVAERVRSSTPLSDFDSIETRTARVCNDVVENVCNTNGYGYALDGDATVQALIPSNKAVASLVTDDVLRATLEDKNLDSATEKLEEIVEKKTKTKLDDVSPGVDVSPCNKVSDNFIHHPQRGSSGNISTLDSPRHSISRDYESGVDTSPAQRVSDNFVSYHRVSMSVPRRSPTPVKEIKSGVDTTPSRRISDNFIAAEASGHSGKRSGSKYGSSSCLDTMGADGQTNNDSGSEVSDEGYRSLGIVPSPQSCNTQGAKSLTASPVRVPRTARSRSVGGTQENQTQSPQQSPFRRNTPVNRSARVSASTAASSSSRNPSNTWNSTGGRSGKKTRPALTQDTFCQQVAEIMQQYAAMMPSPRKDSKPDSGITTRIPAPVQRT